MIFLLSELFFSENSIIWLDIYITQDQINMKKLLSILAVLSVSFGIATAENYNAKNPAPPLGAECTAFDPGFELSAYVGLSLPNGVGDTAWGGGIGVAYFFTENIGADFNWAGFDNDLTGHLFTADLALRWPMKTSCFAPYVIGGGGFITDGDAEPVWRLGGGIDFRPAALGNIGIFADGTYNWIGGDYSDSTIIRLGLRLPF